MLSVVIDIYLIKRCGSYSDGQTLRNYCKVKTLQDTSFFGDCRILFFLDLRNLTWMLGSLEFEMINFMIPKNREVYPSTET